MHSIEILPELEVRVDHPVGETFTANTDAFQHTVTGELMHHQMGVDETWRAETSHYSSSTRIIECDIILAREEFCNTSF